MLNDALTVSVSVSVSASVRASLASLVNASPCCCEGNALPQSKASLEKALRLANIVNHLYARRCDFIWSQHMVAPDADIQDELAWAMRCKSIQARQAV
jgi:hypothetical protein